MLNKTKAALPGRQCQSIKLKPIKNTTMIDLVNRCDYVRIAGEFLTQPLAQFDLVRIFTEGGNPPLEQNQLISVKYGVSGNAAHPHRYLLNGKFRSVSKALKSASEQNQPFGSKPRCCNSLRMMRFIQAASDSSPSCRCASSIKSRSSGSRRNWNGGLPRLSVLCVDTLSTPDVMCLCVMTHYMHTIEKATPRSDCNTTEASYHNVIRGNDHG